MSHQKTKKTLIRQDTTELFAQAYELVKSQISNKRLRSQDILPFAVLAMQIVEKFKISGPKKKELVVQLALQLVEDFVSEKNKANMKFAVKTLLPPTIDQIVAASKGQLDLNPLVQNLSSCCGLVRKKK